MKIYLKVDAGVHIIYKPSEQYWRMEYRHKDSDEEGEGEVEDEEREDGIEDEEEYVKKYEDFVFDDSLWEPSKKRV
jgi:hypothetical protein